MKAVHMMENDRKGENVGNLELGTEVGKDSKLYIIEYLHKNNCCFAYL